MKKPAAIPFFGDAYLADTTHLTTEEHGAYFLLMLAAWRQDDCALPDDDRKLARIANLSPRKWKAIKPTIIDFWTVENGRIHQSRLRRERAWVDQKSESFRKNVSKRWERQHAENKGNGSYQSEYRCDTPPPLPLKKKKEDNNYAFEGRTIRLTERDLQRWAEAYPDLDLPALLMSRDDWITDQDAAARKRWFQSTSNWLANKQQELTRRSRDPARDVSHDGWEYPIC